MVSVLPGIGGPIMLYGLEGLEENKKGNNNPDSGSFYYGMLKGDLDEGVNTVCNVASLNKRPRSKLRGIERGRPTTYSRICYTALPPVLFYIVSYTHFLFLDFLHSFLIISSFPCSPTVAT